MLLDTVMCSLLLLILHWRYVPWSVHMFIGYRASSLPLIFSNCKQYINIPMIALLYECLFIPLSICLSGIAGSCGR